MKKLLFLLPLSAMCCFIACKDDEGAETPEYHVHIESPTDASTYSVGDTLQIAIEFEDHEGGEISHVNVRIYDKSDTSVVVYNQPTEAHVDTPTPYVFEDNFILNVPGDADYILEAKTYDHDSHEGVETAEFHVNQ